MQITHLIVPFLFFYLTHYTFGAVLTVTTKLYIPTVHSNTLAPAENGLVSIIGQHDGTTTFLFQEPQTDSPATLIEASNFAGIIVADGPDLLASYACDIHGAKADCKVIAVNPAQGGSTVKFFSLTDSVDSVALLEALPANSRPNGAFNAPPVSSHPKPSPAPIFGHPKVGRKGVTPPFPAPTRIQRVRATGPSHI